MTQALGYQHEVPMKKSVCSISLCVKISLISKRGKEQTNHGFQRLKIGSFFAINCVSKGYENGPEMQSSK